mgnify:CR=1 FL=1
MYDKQIINSKFSPYIDMNSSIIDNLVIYRSLRICLLLTLSMFIWLYFDLNHGYWIPMTMMIIYMPFDPGVVSKRMLQRFAGTVLGLLLGFLISQIWSFIPYSFVIFPFVLVLVLYTVTKNYFHYVLVLSISVSILLTMMPSGSVTTIQVLCERFIYTFIACLMIVIAEYLFKPRKMIFLKLQNTMLMMTKAYCLHMELGHKTFEKD